MKTKEFPQLKGHLLIQLFDETGALKEEHSLDNLIVSAGLNFIASRMVGAAAAIMSHMALGTGAVAPVAGNTTLGAEIAGSRTALTSGTAANNVVTYAASFGAGVGTGAVTEAGIFNAAVAGTMLNRVTFPVVNKGASDSMQITWTVTVTAP